MSKPVKSNEFAVELSSILKNYSFKVSEGVSDAVRTAGKFAKKEVQKNSPKRTGRYSEGWKVNEEKTSRIGRGTTVYIHNKDRYRLAHLLEYGHQGPNGRVEGHPHIEPARDAAEKLLEGLVVQAIEEAGE